MTDARPEVAVGIVRFEGDEFRVAATRRGVCRLVLATEDPRALDAWLDRHIPRRRQVSPSPILLQLQREMSAYEADGSARFDVPLDLVGTPFQLSVWRLLRRVPAGTTRSYQDLAVALGVPGASRAVGGAVGANPVPLVVPCHRIVGASGSLTGFGGGLATKERLLAHEGVRLRATRNGIAHVAQANR